MRKAARTPYQQIDRQQSVMDCCPLYSLINPCGCLLQCSLYQHICSSHPCRIGNAADYQRLIGIMGLSPLRGSLRAAPSKEETEVSLYPTFPSWQAAAPHGCLISLLIAHSGWRSWRQKISCFEKRGKIRSTELFSCQGTAKEACLPSSHYNGHFFAFCLTQIKKIFYIFPECSFLPLIPLTCPHETLLHSLAWSNP